MNLTNQQSRSQGALSNTSFRQWGTAYLTLGLLFYLWVRVVNHLRVIWSVDEQYAYGWSVPFLCGWLLWRRWQDSPTASIRAPGLPLPSSIAPPTDAEVSESSDLVVPPAAAPVALRLPFSISRFQIASFFLLLVAFLFTRWIEESNPDWRFVGWALALEVIALTLCAVSMAGGTASLRRCAFPLAFFLVAVPWPTVVEQPLIQGLTRGIVAGTVELLNAIGVPALAHGSVIETIGGLVDVDEACSGIRSLQAALMLALFFGEWHRLGRYPRVALCAVAAGLACAFNLARTTVLSLVAAKQGASAIARWHDPASLAILGGCFFGIWIVAAWMEKSRSRATPASNTSEAAVASVPAGSWIWIQALRSRFLSYAVALLLVGEVAIYLWYASAPRAETIEWHAELPEGRMGFQRVELPGAARRILRFDEGISGRWQETDGTAWQMIFLRWNPGRVAAALARNHTPEICLPAAGKKVHSFWDVGPVEAGDLALNFRCFRTDQSGQSVFVFYALWEDGSPEQRSTTEMLTWRARWETALTRRRNSGQRALHLAIRGARDAKHAEQLLRAHLPQLVHTGFHPGG